jgi:hypothetical protein
LIEPAEPVVSAYAIGTAAIAEPMPKAMASAPTRPMQLDKPLCAIDAMTATLAEYRRNF